MAEGSGIIGVRYSTDSAATMPYSAAAAAGWPRCVEPAACSQRYKARKGAPLISVR
jgi:hypothetical protein